MRDWNLQWNMKLLSINIYVVPFLWGIETSPPSIKSFIFGWRLYLSYEGLKPIGWLSRISFAIVVPFLWGIETFRRQDRIDGLQVVPFLWEIETFPRYAITHLNKSFRCLSYKGLKPSPFQNNRSSVYPSYEGLKLFGWNQNTVIEGCTFKNLRKSKNHQCHVFAFFMNIKSKNLKSVW